VEGCRVRNQKFFVNHLSSIDPNQDHGFALYRFSLKRSDGTWSHSVSEIAQVFADDLENRLTPFDFETGQEDRTTISSFGLSFGPPVTVRPVDEEEVRESSWHG